MCQPFCEKTKISIRNSILISLLRPSNQLPSPQSNGDLLLSLSLSHFYFALLLSLAWISLLLLTLIRTKKSSSPPPLLHFLSNHLFYITNSFMSTCFLFDDPCPYPACSSLQSPQLPFSLLHSLSPMFLRSGPSLPSTLFCRGGYFCPLCLV